MPWKDKESGLSKGEVEKLKEVADSAWKIYETINQDRCWYCTYEYAGGHAPDCAWMNLLTKLKELDDGR